MAAATGYVDAPTGEQLLAYTNRSTYGPGPYGHMMAEVFAIRVTAAAGGRPAPCGIISFHGGNCCSKVIYSWSQPDEPTSLQPCDSQGNIVLTGPSLATSAYGPVSIRLCLHDGSREPDKDDKAEIDCDTWSGLSKYDRAIVETVSTGYGPAEVIYAVMTNSVQGRVAVKLVCPDGKGPTGVVGRIVAHSKLFNIGWVLFYNEHDKKVRVGSGELVPLARHVLAVPLHMPLTIELDLYCYSGDDIVRGVVEFNPVCNGQHMERVMGPGGAVLEVAMSWIDYPW